MEHCIATFTPSSLHTHIEPLDMVEDDPRLQPTARFASKSMPSMKFRDFIHILESHGFMLARQRGSHRTYQGVVAGKTRIVVVACLRESDDIRPGTLSSMIRQSGLPKRRFRS